MLILLSLIPAGKTVTKTPLFQNGEIQIQTNVVKHSNPFREILFLLILIIFIGLFLLIAALGSI